MTETVSSPEAEFLERLKAIEAGNLARVGLKTRVTDVINNPISAFHWIKDTIAADLSHFGPQNLNISYRFDQPYQYVTFAGTTNLRLAPFTGGPDHPDRIRIGKGTGLLQSASAPVNTPAIVAAEYDDGQQSWRYLITTAYRGWVPEKDTVPIDKVDIWYDPLRPTVTLENLKERKSSLGFISCAGALEITANGTIQHLQEPYDERFYPLERGRNPAELTQYEKSNGYLPEGIQLLTLGNAVEIKGQTEDGKYSLVQLPGRAETIQIPNEYLQHGFMETTTVNMQSLLAKVPQTYSWGDRMGVNVDCTGLFQRLYSMFGIALPRDTYQQLELEGNTPGVENLNELPTRLSDLSPEIQERLENREAGFIIFVAMGHIVMLTGVDTDGNLLLTHTVGVGRSYSNPEVPIDLWRTFVNTPAEFAFDGHDLSFALSFKRMQEILKSPILMIPLFPKVPATSA